MDFGEKPKGPAGSSNQMDPELQQFIQMETQKAQIQTQVHRVTEQCWDLCVDKPKDKFDSRTENCINNCVGRFVDTALLLTTRLQQKISQGAMH